MARLTRAETQRRNRARVLDAARAEFAERGFREAGIDAIAERAELTRGAVYSNFPGKRALYFEVLAELAEEVPAVGGAPVRTAREALGALARAWVARLPLATGADGPAARIGAGVVPEILNEESARRAYAQLMRFQAVLLGCGLERLDPPAAAGERRVRLAETVLTTLHGASRLAAAAPGFGEPFNVVSACERLADADLGDRWDGPAIAPEPRAADEPWTPPPAFDALRREPAPLAADGVVAVLGLHRFSAAEDVLRAAPEGAEATVVAVSCSPAELGPLARMAVAEVRGLLRRALPPGAWPRLRVVCDESGEVAAAAGVGRPGDATEAAVRVQAGRITARAEGLGAGHAAAAASRGRAHRSERERGGGRSAGAG
ncbi:TetR/AcrR family transcriptional regulator [Streptomonospora arabica]|uniref:TetR/AcrR family transcriptional regulator n=1 Tax=Streptomonospora arabica TaxID=412417 RepID=A0ABV9SKF9_9ACTN